MTYRCEVPRCRHGVAVVYYGHCVCERHWQSLTERQLKKVLRVPIDYVSGTVPELDAKGGGMTIYFEDLLVIGVFLLAVGLWWMRRC